MRRHLSQPPSMVYISHIAHYTANNGVISIIFFILLCFYQSEHGFLPWICTNNMVYTLKLKGPTSFLICYIFSSRLEIKVRRYYPNTNGGQHFRRASGSCPIHSVTYSTIQASLHNQFLHRPWNRLKTCLIFFLETNLKKLKIELLTKPLSCQNTE